MFVCLLAFLQMIQAIQVLRFHLLELEKVNWILTLPIWPYLTFIKCNVIFKRQNIGQIFITLWREKIGCLIFINDAILFCLPLVQLLIKKYAGALCALTLHIVIDPQLQFHLLIISPAQARLLIIYLIFLFWCVCVYVRACVSVTV